MKFVCISDTHGRHHDVKLPSGDLLLHAGDVSGRGHEHEIIDFLEWLKGSTTADLDGNGIKLVNI